MKKCTKCLKNKDLTDFHKNPSTCDGLQYECKPCASLRAREWYVRTRPMGWKPKPPPLTSEEKRKYKRDWYRKDRERKLGMTIFEYETIRKAASKLRAHKRGMLNAARVRAKNKNLPYDLDIDDIEVPSHCPILSIPLYRNHSSGIGHPCPNSPSLDRIIPELGYVKGNVVVISLLANQIKTNASADQIRKVADWLDSQNMEYLR